MTWRDWVDIESFRGDFRTLVRLLLKNILHAIGLIFLVLLFSGASKLIHLLLGDDTFTVQAIDFMDHIVLLVGLLWFFGRLAYDYYRETKGNGSEHFIFA